MLLATFHTDEFKVFPVANNDVVSKKKSEGNVMTAIQGEFLPLKLIEKFPQLIRFLVFMLLMPCHNSPFHKPKKATPGNISKDGFSMTFRLWLKVFYCSLIQAKMSLTLWKGIPSQ